MYLCSVWSKIPEKYWNTTITTVWIVFIESYDELIFRNVQRFFFWLKSVTLNADDFLRKWLECIHCISDMKLIWKQISDKSLTDWTSPMLYSFYASVSKNMSRCCLHLIPVTHPCFGNILGCTLTNQLLNWK